MPLELRKQRIALIREAVGTRQLFDMLYRQLATLSRATLSEDLIRCGVITKEFDHDSSEEKLWAKYCDMLCKLPHKLNMTVFSIGSAPSKTISNSHTKKRSGDCEKRNKLIRRYRQSKNAPAD